MARIIDGLKIANEFNLAIRDRVKDLIDSGVTPKLVTFSIGESQKNLLLSSKVEELAEFTGTIVENHQLDEHIKLPELREFITDLNNDPSVHAIFMQASSPKRVSFRDAINLISPDKDVDGLTTINQGRLFLGEPGMIPCAPLAVLHLLRIVHEDLTGMHAVVLGRSSIVGKPLTQLLLNANCTVTSLHSYSKDIETVCQSADILVSATGNPKSVTRDFIKKGATVIDIGLNNIATEGSPQIVGDVDFDDVLGLVAAITPVPNGVVPMTTSYLIHNTLKLACCA